MNTYETTANLAAGLADDAGAADRVRAHTRGTQLIRTLISMRNDKGLTQRQLARQMSVSPSKVCRMEAGEDKQLNWGDVLQYMHALGVNISLLIDDPGLPAAERIKHHVLTAHKLLEQLRTLAQDMGEGDEIAAKIKEFYGEVLLNFMMRFCDSYSKLPQSGPISISSGPETPACGPSCESGKHHHLNA